MKDLKAIITGSGLEVKKAFNTSGVQYKEEKWKDKIKDLSDAQMIKELNGQGRLMKRPMVLEGDKSSIGFKEEAFLAQWKWDKKVF